MKIGVVIPVYITNQVLYDLYQETINSLTSKEHELFIINIINRQNVGDRIDGYANPKNSVASAWNLGIGLAIENDCDLYFVINHDIKFEPDCLDNLVAFYQANKDNYILFTGLNINPDNYINPNPTYADGNHTIPDFSAFLIDDRLFDKVGPFDEKFAPAYFEDTDMRYRIKKAKYGVVSVKSARMHHYGSSTVRQDKIRGMVVNNSYLANKEYFRKKHGAYHTELID